VRCLPARCALHEGQRGLCFVRGARAAAIVLYTYGRSSGFCIDPIEKKPLNQFLPGTPVLSFGTAGCNLTCRFCQNWDMSKSREMDTLAAQASPEGIARAAALHGCRSVAYTYNDPVIFLEYACDTAEACRALGIRNVAVTAGYVSPGARERLFSSMDAANIDLKAFTDAFYKRQCSANLAPVLETLEYLKAETGSGSS
jgi:pyruvate formate lyase activating enzyme